MQNVGDSFESDFIRPKKVICYFEKTKQSSRWHYLVCISLRTWIFVTKSLVLLLHVATRKWYLWSPAADQFEYQPLITCAIKHYQSRNPEDLSLSLPLERTNEINVYLFTARLNGSSPRRWISPESWGWQLIPVIACERQDYCWCATM